jgi:hypothetical protein
MPSSGAESRACARRASVCCAGGTLIWVSSGAGKWASAMGTLRVGSCRCLGSYIIGANAGAHASKTISRQYAVHEGIRGAARLGGGFGSSSRQGYRGRRCRGWWDVAGMSLYVHAAYAPALRLAERGFCFGREPTVRFTVQVINASALTLLLLPRHKICRTPGPFRW